MFTIWHVGMADRFVKYYGGTVYYNSKVEGFITEIVVPTYTNLTIPYLFSYKTWFLLLKVPRIFKSGLCFFVLLGRYFSSKTIPKNLDPS